MSIINTDVSLREYTTFGINAKSKYLASYASVDELIEVLNFCKINSIEWYALGGGANVIFRGDYDGCVVHSICSDIAFEDGLIVADGGLEWDDFVAFCVGAGYFGLENLSLIPGSVGAAPVQNIGAYGAEAKDFIVWVECLNVESMKVVKIPASQCQFGYRESIFKNELKGKVVITRVAFKLSKDGEFKLDYGAVKERVEQLGQPSLQSVRQAIIEIRKSKLPDHHILPNVGSFFKNPVVTEQFAQNLASKYENMPVYKTENGVKLAAGWLIEKSGWKGKREGKVGVHKDQALVIVNYDNANGVEILDFADKIISDIKSKFNIVLEKEVNVI